MPLLRQPILLLARSGGVKKLVSTMPVTSGIVTSYVPGETTESAVDATARLLALAPAIDAVVGRVAALTEPDEIPAWAAPLVEACADWFRAAGFAVGAGVFGAEMQVALVNHGPVTLWLDSEDMKRPRA